MYNKNIHQLLQQVKAQFPEEGGAIYSCQGMDIQIQADTNGQNLYLFYCVGTCPEQPSAAFMEKMLRANFFGAMTKGGHLGLYEKTNALIYSLSLTAATLDAHSLQNALHLFATTTLELIHYIETWQKEAQSQEKKAPTADLSSLAHFAGMRV